MATIDGIILGAWESNGAFVVDVAADSVLDDRPDDRD